MGKEEVCISRAGSGKAMNPLAPAESSARANFAALTKKAPRPKAEGVVHLSFLVRERVFEVSVTETASRASFNPYLSVIRAFRVGN